MKKAWMLLPVLLWAGVAYGQQELVDGQKVSKPQGPAAGGFYLTDSTYHVQPVDANGNPYWVDYDRDRNKLFAQQIIGPSTIAVGGSDSLAVPITAYPYRHWKLLIKAIPSTGVGVVSRLAFQVRTHYNAQTDSSSTFAEYPLAQGSLGLNALPDTLILGHLTTGSGTAAWSGEFVVDAAANRNAPGSVVAATLWSYPSGIAVPLDNIFGRDFWAPYLSVRVRNLAGPTCVVTVWLVGTPL